MTMPKRILRLKIEVLGIGEWCGGARERDTHLRAVMSGMPTYTATMSHLILPAGTDSRRKRCGRSDGAALPGVQGDALSRASNGGCEPHQQLRHVQIRWERESGSEKCGRGAQI